MKNSDADGCLGCFFLVGFILLILTLITVSPLLTIWALNTLFPVLAIAYTWKTWLSILILSGVISSFISGALQGFFKGIVESFKNQ